MVGVYSVYRLQSYTTCILYNILLLSLFKYLNSAENREKHRGNFSFIVYFREKFYSCQYTILVYFVYQYTKMVFSKKYIKNTPRGLQRTSSCHILPALILRTLQNVSYSLKNEVQLIIKCLNLIQYPAFLSNIKP